MRDETSIWALMPDESRRTLAALGHAKRFAKGQTIFLRGDPGDHVFLIEDGLVEISVTQRSGRKSVLNHMGPGEILGEIALLDGNARSADAVAISDVRGKAIDRGRINRHLKDNPEALIEMVDALCDKVRNATEMFAAQALISAPARLARCLVTIARKWGVADGTAVRIDQDLSQSEIGAFAGLARENVNRHMRAWVDQGLISYEKRRLVLLDPNGLEELAEF